MRNYNLGKVKGYLPEHFNFINEYIIGVIPENNMDDVISKLNTHLEVAHTAPKSKPLLKESISSRCMDAANLEFEKYQQPLFDGSREEIEEAYIRYQKARNAITSDIYKTEYKKWADLTNHISRNKLCDVINWKGNFSKQVAN